MTDRRWREPPEGWSTFGTHVDIPGHLLFSREYDDEDGLPLWERLCPGCDVCRVMAPR